MSSHIDTHAHPHISIVVVARNESKKIRACITSLVEQESGAYSSEIILVDDGSTDQTVEIAAQCCDSLNIIREESRSISHSRNLGWQSANGDFVAYLDADCTAPPHWINTLLSAIQRLGCDAVGGSNTPPQDGGMFYGTLTLMLNSYAGSHTSTQGRIYEQERRVEHLPGLNIMIRRSALERVRGYDESFARVGEDEDLSTRIRYSGGSLYCIPGANVIHYQRNTLRSWASNMFNYGRGRTWLLRRHPCLLSAKFALPVLALLLYPLYLPAIIIYSLFLALSRGQPGKTPALIILFHATHLPYAVGQLCGFLTKGDNLAALNSSGRKTMLMALKNAGNKGDEAILQCCVTRFLRHYESDIARLRNTYIFAFGPSGVDIRQLPRTNQAAQEQVLSMLSADDRSRRFSLASLLDTRYIIYILFSRVTLIVCGGQWFHDLNRLNHTIISMLFATIRITGGNTSVFSIGAGPLNSGFSKLLLRFILGKKSYISLRDEKSLDLFYKAGYSNAVMTPDLAYDLNNYPLSDSANYIKRGKNKTIGLSPCAWTKFDNIYQQQAEIEQNTYTQLVHLIEGLLKRGHEVILIPTMNPEDYHFCQKLVSGAGLQNHPDLVDTRNMYSSQVQTVINSLDLLISMRLHPLIFAWNTATPFLAFNYADKIRQFCIKHNAITRLIDLDQPDWGKTTLQLVTDDTRLPGLFDVSSAHDSNVQGEELDNAYRELFEWTDKR